MFKIFKKIESRLNEIEDVLTREVKDGETNYIGSEIDQKLEINDFKHFQDNVIGKNKNCTSTNGFIYRTITSFSDSKTKNKTLFEEIEALNERFDRLEQYLGIKRIQKEEKVDKYVKIKK